MDPLAWYIAGPLIGITIPALLVLRGKQLGVSSSFRVLGSQIFSNWEYFKYDWKKDFWQLEFALGLVLSSLLIFSFTDIGTPEISGDVTYGIVAENVYTLDNGLIFFFGAVLIGFGARYADGCTAGHCIMGNSQLAPSAGITTVFFFVGGLIATYFVVPQIFNS